MKLELDFVASEKNWDSPKMTAREAYGWLRENGIEGVQTRVTSLDDGAGCPVVEFSGEPHAIRAVAELYDANGSGDGVDFYMSLATD